MQFAGYGIEETHVRSSFFLWQAHLAFAAIKDRKAIGKVMIALGGSTAGRSKLWYATGLSQVADGAAQMISVINAGKPLLFACNFCYMIPGSSILRFLCDWI